MKKMKKKRSGSDASVLMMSDMMTEILLRLPVKSLARFKCLSKKWNQFITNDPYFRANYRNVGGSPVMLGLFYDFYDNDNSEIGFVATSHPHSDHDLVLLQSDNQSTLVGCSNGFLLCFPTSDEKFDPILNYYISNPVTKQSLFLPKPKNPKFADLRALSTGFICHGDHNNHYPSQYKIARALRPQESGMLTTLTLQILESNYPQWKELDLTCSSPFLLCWNYPIIITKIEGIVYIPAMVMPYVYALIVFDHTQEHKQNHLQMIALPPNADHEVGHFGHTNGHVVYMNSDKRNFKMWVLNEHQREWSLVYKHRSVIEHMRQVEILAVHPFDHHLVFVDIKGTTKVWYNVKNSETEIVSFVKGFNHCHHLFFPYVWPCWPPSFLLYES